MGDISRNFSESEFACRCCGVAKIDNNLVYDLQRLRDLTGRKIFIASGYRCRDHNTEVGGAPKSQHLVGKAADIVVQGLSVWEVYDHVMAIPPFRYGGVGIYPQEKFLHVDVRGVRTRWVSIDGVLRPLDQLTKRG